MYLDDGHENEAKDDQAVACYGDDVAENVIHLLFDIWRHLITAYNVKEKHLQPHDKWAEEHYGLGYKVGIVLSISFMRPLNAFIE